MPMYLFVTDDAEERFVEEFFHMKDAPEIGSTVEINGERCRRLPSVPLGLTYKDKQFVSTQLPYNYTYHRGKFNQRGECGFNSMREVRETVACARDHGENLSYGE